MKKFLIIILILTPTLVLADFKHFTQTEQYGNTLDGSLQDSPGTTWGSPNATTLQWEEGDPVEGTYVIWWDSLKLWFDANHSGQTITVSACGCSVYASNTQSYTSASATAPAFYHLLEQFEESGSDGWNAEPNAEHRLDPSTDWTANYAMAGASYSSAMTDTVTIWYNNDAQYHSWDCNSVGLAVVQGWIDGDTTNYGMVFRGAGDDDSEAHYFSSSDAGSNEPIFWITYTATGAGGAQYKIRSRHKPDTIGTRPYETPGNDTLHTIRHGP